MEELQIQVQVVYTVVVPDDIRKEINIRLNRVGKASRADVREWYMRYGSSLDQDLRDAVEAQKKRDSRGGLKGVRVIPDIESTLEQLDTGDVTL